MSAGSNLETMNTVLSGTNHVWAAFLIWLNWLNSALVDLNETFEDDLFTAGLPNSCSAQFDCFTWLM